MDRNSFSIIIPMVGHEQAFDDTLASVLRSQPADGQIIVAHDGSYADPYDLRREVTFVQPENGSNDMASLLNEAIKVAKCPLTAIVRPSVDLPEGWSDSVASAFEKSSVGSVAVPVVSQDSPDRIVTGGVKVGAGLNRKLVGSRQRLKKRSAQRLQPLGPTLWAGFYRTSLLQTIAPLCEHLDGSYLDADIAMAADTLELDCRWLPDVVVTTDAAAAIQKEAQQPHGRSAQRSARRHGLNSGIVNRLVRTSLELLASPLKPAFLPHAFGRLFAGHGRADAKFHDRLLDARDMNEADGTISLSDATSSSSIDLSTRRAA